MDHSIVLSKRGTEIPREFRPEIDNHVEGRGRRPREAYSLEDTDAGLDLVRG
jgi:hypothetical protein